MSESFPDLGERYWVICPDKRVRPPGVLRRFQLLGVVYRVRVGPEDLIRLRWQEQLLGGVPFLRLMMPSRAKSPKAHRTFGDLRLIEGQASRCAIRIDAAAKAIAA